MKVFVSSTVFDLIDVRAEVSSMLRQLGVDPVLSDDKLSGFQTEPRKDSIETCLVNVESCDEFLLILDRRYGPRLGKAGYEDVSATHLEYKRACELEKPIHVYVRDRLDAEFTLWRRNRKHSTLDFSWVQENDTGLFDLLDEHMKLKGGSSRSNWRDTFTTSVDLKAAISNRFQKQLLPRSVVTAMQRNEFPIIQLRAKVSFENMNGVSGLNFSMTVKNHGGSPAFHVRTFWETNSTQKGEPEILSVNQEFTLQAFYGGTKYSDVYVVEYESPIGIKVVDRFKVHGSLSGNLVMGGANLDSRRYFRSTGPTILIEDQE